MRSITAHKLFLLLQAAECVFPILYVDSRALIADTVTIILGRWIREIPFLNTLSPESDLGGIIQMYEELYQFIPQPIDEVITNPSQLLCTALRGLLINKSQSSLKLSLQLLSRLEVGVKDRMSDQWRTKRSVLHV